CRNIGTYVNRGLFGGVVVLPAREHKGIPEFHLPPGFIKDFENAVKELGHHPHGTPPHDHDDEHKREHENHDVDGHAMAMGGMEMGAAGLVTMPGGMAMGHGMPMPPP